jgi:hypothetical protein
MPEKKHFGRREPPPNYPIDPDQYGDPQNYMYPLDRPARAKLARRHFDDPRNRSKYTEDERLFIDSRIDSALKRFGVSTDAAGTRSIDAGKRLRPPRIRKSEIEKLGVDELLQYFLDSGRLERAKAMPDSLVSLSSQGDKVIIGSVKDYLIRIDFDKKTVTHDCDDWKKRARSKLMCKHLGKALLTLRQEEALAILRSILRERGAWSFILP